MDAWLAKRRGKTFPKRAVHPGEYTWPRKCVWLFTATMLALFSVFVGPPHYQHLLSFVFWVPWDRVLDRWTK